MHVIKRSKIEEFTKKYPQTKQALLSWLIEAEHARWTCINDIRERYKTADSPTDHHVIFDIKGNQFRLIVRIHYASEKTQGTIYVRWFGTHADYDRIKDMEKI